MSYFRTRKIFLIMKIISEWSVLNVHNDHALLCVATFSMAMSCAKHNIVHFALRSRSYIFIMGNTQMSISLRQWENKSIVLRASLDLRCFRSTTNEDTSQDCLSYSKCFLIFLLDPNYDIHLPLLLSTAVSTRLNWWPACFLRYYGDPRYLQCRWLRVVSWCWWTSCLAPHNIDRDCSYRSSQADWRKTQVWTRLLPGPEGHRRKAAPARPAIAKTGKTEINVPQMLDSELWGQKGQHSGCLQVNTSSQRGGAYFLNIFTIGKLDWSQRRGGHRQTMQGSTTHHHMWNCQSNLKQ